MDKLAHGCGSQYILMLRNLGEDFDCHEDLYQVPGETSTTGSQQEIATLFRVSLNLFEKWGVTGEQAAILLGMPLRAFQRWKGKGPTSVLPSAMPDCRTSWASTRLSG